MPVYVPIIKVVGKVSVRSKYAKVKSGLLVSDGLFELLSDETNVFQRKKTLVLGVWFLAFSFPRY